MQIILLEVWRTLLDHQRLLLSCLTREYTYSNGSDKRRKRLYTTISLLNKLRGLFDVAVFLTWTHLGPPVNDMSVWIHHL